MSNIKSLTTIRYFSYTTLLGIFIIFSGCKKDTKLSEDLLFAPTNISATKIGSNINITWSSVSGATSYKVYRSSTNAGGYTYLSTSSLTSYIDLLPLNGDNYYKVTTVNSNYQESDKSIDYAYCNFNNGNSAIPVPTGVYASVVDGVVTITWNAVASATSYNIYASLSSSGTYTLLGNVTTAGGTVTNPVIGSTVYYKVTAVNSFGESAFSLYTYCYYAGVTIPSSPYMYTATLSYSGYISLNWSSATGATSYKLYRSATPSGYYTLIGTYSSTSTQDNTPLNRDNYYKVTAVNSAGESTMSNYTYYDYKGYFPSDINTVSSTKIGTSIYIIWSKSSGATSYEIYRSIDNLYGTYTRIGTTTTTSFYDNAVVVSKNYYYQIVPINTYGIGKTSNITGLFYY